MLKMGILSTVIGLGAILLALLTFGPRTLKSNLQENFGGHVEPGFEAVKETFRQNFQNNWDYEGSAFAVCHRGRIVVDLWAGYSDSRSNKLWQEDTMAVGFSTTKAVCAICLAILVDRGYVTYDDLVTKHWPEFGQHNKSEVTIRMLASHQAALAALDEPVTFELIRDWSRMGHALANHRPNWSINKKRHGYHAVTYGFLVDQLIRRIDPKQRSLGRFFHEEVAKPHGLDFYIGLPGDLEHRVAQITLPSKWRFAYEMLNPKLAYVAYKLLLTPSDLLTKIKRNPPWLEPDEHGNITFNHPEFHTLEVGGAGGIGTARALAKLLCLLNIDGKIVSKSTMEKFMQPLFVHSRDVVLELPMNTGHGFFYTKNPQGQFILGHSGYGGQNVKLDPHVNFSLAYLRNGLSMQVGDTSWSYKALENAVYDVIMQTDVNKS